MEPIIWEEAVTIAVTAKKNARKIGLMTACVAVVNETGIMLVGISAGMSSGTLRLAEKIAMFAIVIGMGTDEFRRRLNAGERIIGYNPSEDSVSPVGYAFLIYDQEGNVVGAIGIAGIGARNTDNAREIALEAIRATGYRAETCLGGRSTEGG